MQQPWELNMYLRHVEMNNALYELTKNKNVSLIDINIIITSNNVHADNIRHYKKKIYIEIVKKLAEIYGNKLQSILKINNEIFINTKLLIECVWKAILRKLDR